MVWYKLLLATVAAYLLGSIPTGYLVIYVMKGRDIRTIGSGRTGGTNAIRAGDILKGIAAMLVARAIAGHVPVVEVLAGVAAVVGHNWSVFMNFRGGAGTGPNIGACIALWPLSAVWLIPLLPFGLNVVRYASLTSLIIAAVIPITLAIRAALGYGLWLHVLYGVLAAVAVTWALRPNIKRILNGTEPRAPKLLSE
jgi:glycerol-3-phosphate acyltransferase PlsY